MLFSPISVDAIARAPRVAVDLETCDPDLKTMGPGVRRGAYICGFSVAVDGLSFYAPIRHESDNVPDPEKALAWLRDAMATKTQKVFANALYDLDFLFEAGIRVNGPLIDVQGVEALIDENQREYNLERLGQKYLKRGKEENEARDWVEEHLGKAAAKDWKAHIWRVPGSIVARYAETDAELPLEVLDKQLAIIKDEDLEQVLDLECRLLRPVLQMRRRGVRLDMERLEGVGVELDNRGRRAQSRLNMLAGDPKKTVNVNSAKQLAAIYSDMGVAFPLTEKGNPSFAKEWLAAQNDPVSKLVMDVRRFTKLNGTFIEGLKKHAIRQPDGHYRVYTQFHPLKGDTNGTVSGRFSSSGPNLQNIPSRDKELAPLIRGIFVPEPGNVWFKLDWSQIEYRILLHYAKGDVAKQHRRLYADEPTTDFHVMVGDSMGIPRSDRTKAKGINFGLVYGLGVPSLAGHLGVDVDEARDLYELHHDTVPYAKELDRAVKRIASTRGYVHTLSGRRARFPFWEARDWEAAKRPENKALRSKAMAEKIYGQVRRAFTHAALNRVIQGGAADAMKKAVVDLFEAKWHGGSVPLLTVHDELDFELPEDEARIVVPKIRKTMESVYPLRVPLLCDVEMGPDWGHVEEWS